MSAVCLLLLLLLFFVVDVVVGNDVYNLGHNSSNRNFLVLSGIEIYGELYEDDDDSSTNYNYNLSSPLSPSSSPTSPLLTSPLLSSTPSAAASPSALGSSRKKEVMAE